MFIEMEPTSPSARARVQVRHAAHEHAGRRDGRCWGEHSPHVVVTARPGDGSAPTRRRCSRKLAEGSRLPKAGRRSVLTDEQKKAICAWSYEDTRKTVCSLAEEAKRTFGITVSPTTVWRTINNVSNAPAKANGAFFFRDDGATVDMILELLDHAKKSIDVIVYIIRRAVPCRTAGFARAYVVVLLADHH